MRRITTVEKKISEAAAKAAENENSVDGADESLIHTSEAPEENVDVDESMPPSNFPLNDDSNTGYNSEPKLQRHIPGFS